jgi:hypothetical protein
MISWRCKSMEGKEEVRIWVDQGVSICTKIRKNTKTSSDQSNGGEES